MNPSKNPITSEERQSLWLLTTSPTIWMVHFIASYALAANWCPHSPVPIVVLGVGALAGITLTGLQAWRKHSYQSEGPPHDRDTPEDRHRFLGLAAALLSGLSAIATVYVMLSAVLVRTCAPTD